MTIQRGEAGTTKQKEATMWKIVNPLCVVALCVVAASASAAEANDAQPGPVYFDVARGSHPHDVAAVPNANGPVYFTEQMAGKLGILDPRTGRYEEIPLGRHSAPHGVVVGPDGAAWITDGGQNAIVRFDPKTREVRAWPLPDDAEHK